MMIIDGKKEAENLRQEIKKEIAAKKKVVLQKFKSVMKKWMAKNQITV